MQKGEFAVTHRLRTSVVRALHERPAPVVQLDMMARSRPDRLAALRELADRPRAVTLGEAQRLAEATGIALAELFESAE
jgi:hypothetical protein